MSVRPPKPWERAGAGTASISTTSALGAATAGPKPWELPPGQAAAAASTAVTRTAASRPWEHAGTAYNSPASTVGTSGYGGTYGSGGYGSTYGSTSYGSAGYGSGTYGSTGYGSSSMYGSSPYGSSSMYGGSSMYGRPAGSSMYGSSYGGGYGSNYGSQYGAGAMTPYASRYGGGMGGGYGGMGMGMGGMGQMGPPGPYDPNDPNSPPPQPPSAWQHMLHVVGGIMHFFGRLSFLVDENAHAVHFFISALLQLLDRAGSLYGELARFIFRMLGIRTKAKEAQMQPNGQKPGAPPGQPRTNPLPGLPGALTHRATPQPAGATNWDNVWAP